MSQGTKAVVAIAVPNNWTFLEELQSDERAVDFFLRVNTSLRLLTAATDWYDRYGSVLRDDVKGGDKVVRAIRHLRDKATDAQDS